LYHRGDARRTVSRALSGGVSVIGALTLVEYMPGADLGIDELLFTDLEDAVDPGRMSPTTAGSFLALGLSLVLIMGRPRAGHMVAEWLALGAGLVSMLALLGNVYGVRALYAVGDYEEVALHPAVTMFVCSGAILCARPTRGLMSVVSSDGPGGSLARRLLPAAILVPAIIGGLLIAGEQVGMFDVEHETALFAASSIVCFTALTWWTASATLHVDVARRAAQEAVRASEEDLATTLHSIGDAVIATDTHGRITRMNPVAEQLTGWSFDEARSRHLDDVFDIVSEATGDRVESPVSRVLRDGKVVGLANHSVLIPRGGEPRPIANSGAPIHDGDSMRGVVLVFRDVSEERRGIDTLRRAEAHLRQSQKMEAVNRLAGGIAHDFNNLLTVIISYGYILQRRAPPDDPSTADLAELVRAANRAAELTRQLLAFSRRQVMQPSIVDLAGAIGAMANMLRRVIGEDVQLDIVADSALDPVHVDPSQLEQVILNLVINARDAMPQGGRITITTANTEGAYVRMSVRDTGVGMDEATVAQVFEPFFTTKEAGKGTGLGLPTVLGIVEQSGGHIVVESSLGRG
ncbi:MAG TPA: ATP-binding protein, partial [Kofleriaceae bacterium]|nr:ATP-binding protein [Kofleriaceae bacterium]